MLFNIWLTSTGKAELIRADSFDDGHYRAYGGAELIGGVELEIKPILAIVSNDREEETCTKSGESQV